MLNRRYGFILSGRGPTNRNQRLAGGIGNQMEMEIISIQTNQTIRCKLWMLSWAMGINRYYSEWWKTPISYRVNSINRCFFGCDGNLHLAYYEDKIFSRRFLLRIGLF